MQEEKVGEAAHCKKAGSKKSELRHYELLAS